MIQGWHNEDYLILFDDQNEAVAMTDRYAIKRFLPEHTLIGLKSWDDFILCDANNRFFTIPTVPLDPQQLERFDWDIDVSNFQSDERFTDQLKWYTKPTAFGGDPHAEGNMVWITIEQHIGAVKWWNQLYRDLKQEKQGE